MTKGTRRSVQGLLPLILSVAMIAIIGCEWEGSGSDDYWSESYGYMDFSGIYRPALGNTTIVTTFTTATTPGATQETVENREIGTGDGVSTVYNGVLAERPIIPGSVSIVAGGFQVTDSNGELSGTGATGDINYNTGAWSIDFGASLGDGTPILATWTYNVPGDDPEDPVGSTEPVYQIVVQHAGNRVTLIDDAGHSFEGRLGAVDTVRDVMAVDGRREVEQRFSFVAEGVAYGRAVRIVGSFQALVTHLYAIETSGDDDDNGDTTESYTLLDSVVSFFMEGTWIEEDRTGHIDAIGPENKRVDRFEDFIGR